MLTAGVDVGSLATKAAVLDTRSAAVLGGACLPSGPDPAETARKALERALAAAEIEYGELSGIIATGYGRARLDFAPATVTEITCAARGAHLLDPAARTVIDIGGQDSKVVRLDQGGYATDFAINDRCAAGTGRFLEVMAEALGTTVAEFDELALSAASPAKITRTCTVFAESEVVGLLAGGVEPSCIAAGLCRAVAERTAHLAGQVGVRAPVMLVGGVARNTAVAADLGRLLETDLTVPEDPQLVVAIGAAVVAAEPHAGRLGALAAEGGARQ